jgi:DNA-binding FadR family transcriptional regulator
VAHLAKTTAERVASFRARKKSEGFTTVSVLIPTQDTELFMELAAQRRKQRSELPESDFASRQWLASVALHAQALSTGGEQVSNGHGQGMSQAEALVGEIMKRIYQLGWPVGLPLGSQSDLMQEYKVSRAVLRQAIRLLEHDSIATVQRGAGGGLVVARPDMQATTRAIKVYLEYARIGPSEILATRQTLEAATVSLVVARLNQEGEQRLRDQIATEAGLDGRANADELLQFHFLLGELCGDAALRLFTSVVLQLADAHSTFHFRSLQDRNAVVKRVKHLHARIAEALIARDKEQALALMDHYIGGIKAWLT